MLPGFDIAGGCHSAAATGGDFFDYIAMPNGSWGIVIADVSTHGFAPALSMAETRRLMRTLVKYHTDLGEILTIANRALVEDTETEHFVTLFFAQLDPATGALTYVSKPIRKAELHQALAQFFAAEDADIPHAEAAATSAPIDWSAALKHVDHDHKLLRAVAGDTLEEMPVLLERLKQALDGWGCGGGGGRSTRDEGQRSCVRGRVAAPSHRSRGITGQRRRRERRHTSSDRSRAHHGTDAPRAGRLLSAGQRARAQLTEARPMTSILVVDDSAIDRRVAGGLLDKHADWSVLYADNGIRALDMLESDLPDLVVTDLQMPELDGLQLVERIKVEYPLIPVVLMTGAGSEKVAVEALQKGAASYVPKNALAGDLVETVERLLAISQDRRVQRRLFNYLTEVEYVLENDLELISALVGELRSMVQERRLLHENESLRVTNALDEALANAYFHGNLEVSSELREQDATAYYVQADQRRHEAPYRNRRITVSARFGREQLIFTVRDEGPGFDPAQIPDPTAPGFLERPCGRGVFLMRSFVDEVVFSPQGNEVTLVKQTRWSSHNDAPDED